MFLVFPLKPAVRNKDRAQIFSAWLMVCFVKVRSLNAFDGVWPALLRMSSIFLRSSTLRFAGILKDMVVARVR